MNPQAAIRANRTSQAEVARGMVRVERQSMADNCDYSELRAYASTPSGVW